MPPGQSALSCKACRRLKRKCNRNLPSCSLCVRLNKFCEYPNSHGAGSAGTVGPEVIDLNKTSEGVEARNWPSPNTSQNDRARPGPTINDAFPSSYLLDPDHFTMLPPNALCGSQAGWAHAMPRLTQYETNEICERYVSTIHTWFPFLSQKRLCHQLETPSQEAEPARALLSLAMKLCTQSPSPPSALSNDGEKLYAVVKERCFEAESTGCISLRLIQSLILLAVYELGQAVHPCAYLTIGRAARLCGLIGLQSRKHSQQLFQEPDTWTLREEERRTWWAVFILDRVVNLGTTGLPFSVPEPGKDTLLPCCDTDWNAGRISHNQALLARTLYPGTRPPGFAGTCQAAHMLSKVLTHIDPERCAGMDVTGRLLEALRFHEAFVVFDSGLQEPLTGAEGLASLISEEAVLPALAICCSARFLLYNQYGCNEADKVEVSERIALEAEAQLISIRDIEAMASTTVPKIARSVVEQRALAEAAPRGSPLVAHCLYHAATECVWFIKEYHEERVYVALREIVGGLRAVGRDWRVGVEYLALLEKAGVLELSGKDTGGSNGGQLTRAPA